jgi:hypothetical protein
MNEFEEAIRNEFENAERNRREAERTRLYESVKALSDLQASDLIQSVRDMIEAEQARQTHEHDWKINGVEEPGNKPVHPMLSWTPITRVLLECKQCHWLEVQELEGKWTEEQVKGTRGTLPNPIPAPAEGTD